MIVVCLCAAWCDTCTEFRIAFDRIARQRPDMRFVWLDVEDDSALCGDIDVENFPTLAVYRGRSPVHFGVCLPHETTVGRLLDALADGAPALRGAPDEVSGLPGKFG